MGSIEDGFGIIGSLLPCFTLSSSSRSILNSYFSSLPKQGAGLVRRHAEKLVKPGRGHKPWSQGEAQEDGITRGGAASNRNEADAATAIYQKGRSHLKQKDAILVDKNLVQNPYNKIAPLDRDTLLSNQKSDILNSTSSVDGSAKTEMASSFFSSLPKPSVTQVIVVAPTALKTTHYGSTHSVAEMKQYFTETVTNADTIPGKLLTLVTSFWGDGNLPDLGDKESSDFSSTTDNDTKVVESGSASPEVSLKSLPGED